MHSELTYSGVYNSVKKVLEIDHCQNGTTCQEFVQRPRVFNNVVNYPHDAICGFVIKAHVTVGGVATLLYYQETNQIVLETLEVYPTEWISY